MKRYVSVGSRRREFAIRLAAGAQRRDVLGLVLSEAIKPVGMGLLAGMGVAIALARVATALRLASFLGCSPRVVPPCGTTLGYVPQPRCGSRRAGPPHGATLGFGPQLRCG
jgi:ABC-type antimicrobial peptide transport system permease subunit